MATTTKKPTVKQILKDMQKKKTRANLHRVQQNNKISRAIQVLNELVEDNNVIFSTSDNHVVDNLIAALFRESKIPFNPSVMLYNEPFKPDDAIKSDLVVEVILGRFDEGCVQFNIEVRRYRSGEFFVHYNSV